MGLDQYAYAVRAELVGDAQVDFFTWPADETASKYPDEVGDEFFYWRKHPDLHRWMERRYRHKGGKGAEFNGDVLRLTAEDLDILENAVKRNKLPRNKGKGFFFGESDPYDMEQTQKFIKQARDKLAEGLVVFYDSSW